MNKPVFIKLWSEFRFNIYFKNSGIDNVHNVQEITNESNSKLKIHKKIILS